MGVYTAQGGVKYVTVYSLANPSLFYIHVDAFILRFP